MTNPQQEQSIQRQHHGDDNTVIFMHAFSFGGGHVVVCGTSNPYLYSSLRVRHPVLWMLDLAVIGI